MKKIVLTTAGLALIAAPMVTVISCGSDGVSFDPALHDSAIIVTGKVGHNDKGFLQGGWDGLVSSKADLEGLKNIYETQTNGTDEKSSREGTRAALNAGAYSILGVGYQFGSIFNSTDFAKNYSDRQFIGIDTDISGTLYSNVTSVGFKGEQSSFLAGVATGLYLTKNYSTYSSDGGLIAGAYGGSALGSVTGMINGFMQGIAYYNDNLALDDAHKVKFIGWNGADNGFGTSFVPDGKGATFTKTLVNTKKADIIYPVAGGQVNEVITTLKGTSVTRNVKVVGVDSDQTKIFETDGHYFFTSAMKDTKNATIEAYKAIYADDGKSTYVETGKQNTLGVKGNFVGLAEGELNSDDFAGKVFKDLLKSGQSIIDTSETAKNIYEQLNANDNKVNIYANDKSSGNWATEGKTYFDKSDTFVPTLNDFTAW